VLIGDTDEVCYTYEDCDEDASGDIFSFDHFFSAGERGLREGRLRRPTRFFRDALTASKPGWCVIIGGLDVIVTSNAVTYE